MTCEGPVILRRADAADAAGIAQVHVRGWQKSHEGLVPAEYLSCISGKVREEFWRGELEVEASDRMPWMALVEDRVVGFASAGLSRDEDAGPDSGEVYLVYVDPDCWRRGIGQTLLSHVIRDLREHGFSQASFWALAGNSNAIAFAEKHGWSADGASRFENCGGTKVKQVRYLHAIA